jgi:hypothetical protein
MDAKYEATTINIPEENIAKARMNLSKYREEYKKAETEEDEEHNMYDTVWYSDPIKPKGHDARWPVRATIMEKMYDSYKIVSEDGRIMVANRKDIKAGPNL